MNENSIGTSVISFPEAVIALALKFITSPVRYDPSGTDNSIFFTGFLTIRMSIDEEMLLSNSLFKETVS